MLLVVPLDRRRGAVRRADGGRSLRAGRDVMSWPFEPGAVQALVREPPMEIVSEAGPRDQHRRRASGRVLDHRHHRVPARPGRRASHRALLNEGPAQQA
ncbi:hypothetical protein ACRAWD_08160 [Caulobacter segnis]